MKQGLWDKPCTKDSECLFNGANKNYPNKFGKCLKMVFVNCQENMENLGYKFYKPLYSNRPLCYNCNNNKWKPVSSLGFCCTEQQYNRKKYHFLKSPDYAFKNDYSDRMNAYYKKNCYLKNGVMTCN